MRVFRVLALASIAFASAATAETVTSFDLENGMQVVVIEDHRAPVVVHMVWYRVGSADEGPGVSGVAHFLEHLMFKGTDTVAPGEFSATVEANGGDDNAFTSWDYTAYFQRIAADRLDLVMRMEADRMRGLKLSEEDVVTERAVVLEERNKRTENDPGALFGEQRRAAQYLNLRYGTPVIGWKHEIEALNRDDALAFYKTFYAPNNAILIVAGDVTPDAVRTLAETHYGPIAPTVDLPERLRPTEPPQLSERRLSYADPRVAQPTVIRTYLAPERDAGNQSEAAALTVLAELLGGSPTTSVLARKLQFESQIAVYSGVFYDGVSLDATTLAMAVVPVPGVSPEEAEAALDGALAGFLKDGVDAEEFQRIKTQISAAEIYARDVVRGLAQSYGEALTSGLTIADVQAWPDALRAVTPDDVMAAARKVLDRKNAVTGFLTRPDAASAPAGETTIPEGGDETAGNAEAAE
ncbi:MAG: pitrilysin family protein [Paracoccaceae bacterium]